MDLSSHKFFQSPSVLAPNGEPSIEANNMSLYGKKSKGNNNNNNPFADDDFPDPLCKLNLKETSEFVKSFPVPNGNIAETRTFIDVSSQKREGVNNNNSHTQLRRILDAPSTPGRPVFSFTSIGRNLSRKGFPSKWDDAEKWLMSTSCHYSPAHGPISVKVSDPSSKIRSTQSGDDDGFKQHQQMECFSKVVPSFRRSTSLDHHNMFGTLDGVSCPTEIVLKDKFTESIEPNLPSFKYSQPTKEGFLFRNQTTGEAMQDACTEVSHEVQHRDIGTEMTPLGSSTTSRCHTPIQSSSPQRHNTPASRSGLLAMANVDKNDYNVDLIQLEECHFSKLQLGTQYDFVHSNWTSSGDEEEEISKSLRHNSGLKGDSDCRAPIWEEEEKTKSCIRYQREEAKIQAWLNLQNAKAEAQSKKLEVKIQKMRSNLEEKLMKRMTVAHRKAEEWRASARQQHLDQIQKATQQAQKMMIQNNRSSQFSKQSSCGCFPCHNNNPY